MYLMDTMDSLAIKNVLIFIQNIYSKIQNMREIVK